MSLSTQIPLLLGVFLHVRFWCIFLTISTQPKQQKGSVLSPDRINPLQLQTHMFSFITQYTRIKSSIFNNLWWLHNIPYVLYSYVRLNDGITNNNVQAQLNCWLSGHSRCSFLSKSARARTTTATAGTKKQQLEDSNITILNHTIIRPEMLVFKGAITGHNKETRKNTSYYSIL